MQISEELPTAFHFHSPLAPAQGAMKWDSRTTISKKHLTIETKAPTFGLSVFISTPALAGHRGASDEEAADCALALFSLSRIRAASNNFLKEVHGFQRLMCRYRAGSLPACFGDVKCLGFQVLPPRFVAFGARDWARRSVEHLRAQALGSLALHHFLGPLVAPSLHRTPHFTGDSSRPFSSLCWPLDRNVWAYCPCLKTATTTSSKVAESATLTLACRSIASAGVRSRTSQRKSALPGDSWSISPYRLVTNPSNFKPS